VDNTKIWDEVCTVPPQAQKSIKGGRLFGMTDISPIWRYRKMTELFGACGAGWRYRIMDTWQNQHGEQKAVFVKIELEYKNGDTWSSPIPAMGGSMLAEWQTAKDKTKYIYFCDEAYKMALTDALSVAMKMIGVGADIYAGQSDSKYTVAGQETIKPLVKKEPAELVKIKAELLALAIAKGMDKLALVKWLDAEDYNREDVNALMQAKIALAKI